MPYAQQPALAFEPPLNLIVRTDARPADLVPAVRAAFRAVDAALPLANVSTLDAHVGGMTSTERFSAVITAALAISGLALAAVGLYGVMAFSVSQRTNEIGVRVALGASRSDIMRLVVGRAAVLVAAGLIVGLAGARLGADRMTGLLFDVAPGDPATFFVVAIVLAVVGLGASFGPARHATRVDPIRAIKHS